MEEFFLIAMAALKIPRYGGMCGVPPRGQAMGCGGEYAERGTKYAYSIPIWPVL